MRRFVIAFAVAPVVPAVLVGMSLVVLGLAFGDPDPFSTFAFVAFYVGIVSYAHAILLGIPVVLFLARVRRLTLPLVLGASAAIGALPYVLLASYWEVSDTTGSSSSNGVAHSIDGVMTLAGWVSHATNTLMLVTLAGCSGLVWWWLAIRSARVLRAPTPRSLEG